jgi:hypothetical protein
MATTPAETRSRKGSVKETAPLISADLILECEERIKACFRSEISKLIARVDKIESVISSVQTECVRLDEQILRIKDVICDQQIKIENYEKHLRADKVIVHNVPENDIFVGTEKIERDLDKINLMCRSVRVDITPDKIVSVRRLGIRQKNKCRPLKVTLSSKDHKFKLLNCRRDIASSSDLQKIFQNRIFVNPDNSILVQKEELRLREKLKCMKKENPGISIYIKAGKLCHDDKVIDEIDIKKQLF